MVAQLAVFRAHVEHNVDDRHHLQTMGGNIGDIAAEIGLQPRRGGALGGDLRPHKGRSSSVHAFHHLLNQLLLAAEVIGDHALANVRPPGDLSQRCLSIAQRGDRLDRALDELCPVLAT